MTDRKSLVVRDRLGHALIVFGAAVLLLWLVHPSLLSTFLPGTTAPTKPAAALALLLLGVAVVSPPRWWRHVSLAVVALVSLLVLGAVVTGHESVFDTTLHPGYWRPHSPDHSGTFAVGTAVGLLASVSALLLASRWRGWASALAALAFADSYVALVGHLYGTSGLYLLQTATVMSIPTGLALLVAAVVVAISRPDMPLATALRARGMAGVLVRQMLPWGLLLPPVVGWLQLTGVRHGWFSNSFGVSLMVLAYAGSTVLALLFGVRTATRLEQQRQAASDALAALNAELTDRVELAVAETRAGRERVSFLLDSTPVGIFETGTDGQRRYVNQRWRQLTGVADDGTGHEWSEVLHPDDRDRVREEWAQARAEGREYVSRYRYLRADGGITWAETTAGTLRDENGEVTGWLGSVTDVTRQVEAAESLAESERRYRSVVSALVEGVLMQGPDGRVISANAAACTVLGVEAEQLIDNKLADVLGLPQHEDGTTFTADELPSRKALTTGLPVEDVTMGVVSGHGPRRWLRVNAVPLGGDPPTGIVTTFVDVTDRLASQAALRRSEEQFRLAMAHAPVGMALVSLDGHFLEANEALARMTGYAVDELVGRTFQQITHPDDIDGDLEQVGLLMAGSITHYTMEKRYIRADGEQLWVLLAVSMVRDDDGSPAYFISQIQDVTAARATQQRLVHRALHDPLTGLANRELILDHLERAAARAQRHGDEVAVLFVDLDHFKDVNDTYGHEVGDTLLVAVAERLSRAVRPADTVGRLGGDEFVVVIEDVPDDDLALTLVRRIQDELAHPVGIAGRTHHVAASIGVTQGVGRDARAMLREADEAMYRAKALGRGRYELYRRRRDQVPAEVTKMVAPRT